MESLLTKSHFTEEEAKYQQNTTHIHKCVYNVFTIHECIYFSHKILNCRMRQQFYMSWTCNTTIRKSMFVIKSPKIMRKNWRFFVNSPAIVHPFTLYCYIQQQWMTFEPKKHLGLHSDRFYFLSFISFYGSNKRKLENFVILYIHG